MTHSGTDGSEAGYTLVAPARRMQTSGVSIWLAGVLAFVLLIGAGVAYRVAASGLHRIRDNPISLPMPLRTIPIQIGEWTGREMSLKATTEEYMRENFADDFISRQYTNPAERAPADVYVVYCSSYPSGLLGHRPDVCFPANGWIHDHTTETEVTLRSGQTMKCLSHQFHKAPPDYGQVFILSFYVLNGQITLRERDFAGIFGRTPNISGNPARYVAQVQISSVSEQLARLAARDMVDTILTFLPDPQGRVKTASSFGPTTANQGTDARR